MTAGDKKLGSIIHRFTDAPLQLDLLLFPERRSALSAKERQRYEKIDREVKYAGRGKRDYNARNPDRMEYRKHKPGFYVLNLPRACSKDSNCTIRDRVDTGFKLGISTTDKGLKGRLGDYYIAYADTVTVLHLRVFQSEDLHYFSHRKRTNEFENAIKQHLNRRGILPVRGGAGHSEYYEDIAEIKKSINAITADLSLITDVNQNEYDRITITGEEDEVTSASTKESGVTGPRTRTTEANIEKVAADKEQAKLEVASNKYVRIYSKFDGKKMSVERGILQAKLKARPEEDRRYNIIWDHEFFAHKAAGKKGKVKPKSFITLPDKLRGQKKDGGWVLESESRATDLPWRNFIKYSE